MGMYRGSWPKSRFSFSSQVLTFALQGWYPALPQLSDRISDNNRNTGKIEIKFNRQKIMQNASANCLSQQQ